MPDFTPTGVELQARNFQGFLRDLGRADSAVQSFGRQAESTVQPVNRLGTAFSAGLGAAVGTFALNAITAFGSRLVGLGQQALGVVASFESLTISIETLAAREAQAADETLSMEGALEAAAPRAQELLRWIERLAVESPFTQESVALAFRTVLAYGFGTKEAQRLTSAILNLSAATGRGQEVMGRIALALGQIRARGRLAGEEIRQLTEAGLPVLQILADEFGITTAEVQDLSEKGLIPANDAILALVESIEKDFAGSGARFTKTFSGLLSTLQDVRDIGLRELFTGTFQAIQPLLAQFAETLTSDQFRANLRAVGELLGNAVAGGIQRVGAAASTATTFVRDLDPQLRRAAAGFVLATVAALGLATALNTARVALAVISLVVGGLAGPVGIAIAVIGALGAAWAADIGGMRDVLARAAGEITGILVGLAREAVRWGRNIGESLAEGIVRAARSIIRALNVVGRAIASLLRPGSPPALLPDLDTWGTEAANVWLEGWTEADFDLFDQLSGQIEGVLRAAGAAGNLGEKSVLERVLGSREVLAQAIQELNQTGKITEQTFARIREAAGPVGEEVEELVRRYARLHTATEALNAVNERLNQLQQEQQATLDQSRIAELESILADPRATEGQRARAQAELETIQLLEQRRQLEAEVSEAQEGVSEIQSRVDVERETLGLLGEQASLLERLGAAAASLGDAFSDALDPLNDQLEAIRLQQAELQDTVRLAEIEAKLQAEGLSPVERKTLELERQEILLNRQIRDLQAAELGIDLTEVRQLPVALGEATTSLDDQLEILQLQTEELEGIRRLASINKQLADAELTPLQRKTLELEKQEEILARTQRDQRATELGIDLSGLRDIPVLADDLESAGGAAGELDSILGESESALDDWEDGLSAAAEEVEATIGDLTEIFTGFEGTVDSFSEGLDRGTRRFNTFVNEIQARAADLAGLSIFEDLRARLFGTTEREAGTGALTAVEGLVPIQAIRERLSALFSSEVEPGTGEVAGFAGAVGDLRQRFEEFAAAIAQRIAPLVDRFRTSLAEARQVIEETGIVDDLRVTFENLSAALGPLIGLLVRFSGVVLLGVASALVEAIPAAVTIAVGALKVILGIVNLVAIAVRNLTTFVTGALSGDFAGAWETARSTVDETVRAIIQIVSGFALVVGGAIDELIRLIIGFFRGLYDALVGRSIIPELVEQIIFFVTTLGTRFLTLIEQLVANVVQAFVDLAARVVEDLTAWVAAIVGEDGLVPKLVSDFIDLFTSDDGLLSQLGDLADDFVDAGKELIGGLWEGIKDRFDDLLDDAKDLWDDLTDTLPFSPPKDKSSPLTKLPAAGEAIIAEIQRGIDRTRGLELTDTLEGALSRVEATVPVATRLAPPAVAGQRAAAAGPAGGGGIEINVPITIENAASEIDFELAAFRVASIINERMRG